MNDWRTPGKLVYWGRLAVGALAVALAFWQAQSETHTTWTWLAGVVFAVANLVALSFPIKLRDLEFTTNGVVLVAAMLVFPQPIPLLVAVTPSVLADLRARKETYKIFVNAASDATTVVLPALVFDALADSGHLSLNLTSVRDVVAIFALALGYHLLNAVPPTLMLALAWGRKLLPMLRTNLQALELDVLGTSFFGVLAAYIWLHEPQLTLALVALAVIVYRAFEVANRLTRETVEALETIADVVDERDAYTFNHSLLVARYARLVAERLTDDSNQVDVITRAAYLHDIGKLGIPDSILNKPGRLTDEEFEKIQAHPAIGARILQRYSQFREGMEIVLAHQEKFDGTGYPRGLKGTEIPLGARIVAVIDAYVAMTTDRPYRRPMRPADALEELRRSVGTHFDPTACATFIDVLIDNNLADADQVGEMERLRRLRDMMVQPA